MKQSRYITRCKEYSFLTYATWDTVLKTWVEDTESTDFVEVEQYTVDMNDENEQAPCHGSIYGEPCGDRI